MLERGGFEAVRVIATPQVCPGPNCLWLAPVAPPPNQPSATAARRGPFGPRADLWEIFCQILDL